MKGTGMFGGTFETVCVTILYGVRANQVFSTTGKGGSINLMFKKLKNISRTRIRKS